MLSEGPGASSDLAWGELGQGIGSTHAGLGCGFSRKQSIPMTGALTLIFRKPGPSGTEVGHGL